MYLVGDWEDEIFTCSFSVKDRSSSRANPPVTHFRRRLLFPGNAEMLLSWRDKQNDESAVLICTGAFSFSFAATFSNVSSLSLIRRTPEKSPTPTTRLRVGDTRLKARGLKRRPFLSLIGIGISSRRKVADVGRYILFASPKLSIRKKYQVPQSST